MEETVNPYAAPVTATMESYEVNQTRAIVPAKQSLRFCNYLVDGLAFLVLQFGLGFAAGVFLGQAGVEIFEKFGTLLSLGILVFYYAALEATTSRTLGKLVTGTMVVNEQGGKPSVGQCIGRSFARLIPFEAFSFFGTPTRGWHDSLPKTYVVKAR